MPKFTYSASKDIEQTSGYGFIIEDVAIQPSTYAYTSSGATANAVTVTDKSAVIILTSDATLAMTLPNGDVIGEEKKVVVTAGTDSLQLIDAGAADIRGAGVTTVGDVYSLVYTATDTWKLLA